MQMTSARQGYRQVFSIVDSMVDEAVHEVELKGKSISCRKGCSHCCHLLVEISWEEASQLADWVARRSPARRKLFVERLRRAAIERRRFFRRKKRTERFAAPFPGNYDIPERTFTEYFVERRRPCPFLVDGACAAYSARPTPCRLHLVSSPPELCAHDSEDDSDYEVPKPVERLRRRAGNVIVKTIEDGRYGELAILTYEVLKQRGVVRAVRSA